jgi:CheY-like chemotaxis protein
VGLAVRVFLGSEEEEGRSRDRGAPERRGLVAVGGGAAEEQWERREISVVVVEDDPAMRLLVKLNLERAGFRVVLAETGAEGLDAVAAIGPDVVLLDVMLPDLGGFEVAQRVKGVPVVFMSARASASDYQQGREAGAIDYVTKPFDPVALPARLREDLVELDRGGTAAHVWAMRFGSAS